MKHSFCAASFLAFALFPLGSWAQVNMARGACNQIWAPFTNCSFEIWDLGIAPRNWEAQSPTVRKTSVFEENEAIDDSLSMELIVTGQGAPHVRSFEDGGGHRVDTAYATIRYSYQTSLLGADDRFFTDIVAIDRTTGDTAGVARTVRLPGAVRPVFWLRASTPIAYRSIAVNDPAHLLIEVEFFIATLAPSEPTIGSAVLIDNLFASSSITTSLNASSSIASVAASTWQSDAEVVAASSSSLDPDGLSAQWEITYFSPTATKTGNVGARIFVVELAEVLSEASVDISQLASSDSFELDAFDAGSATQAADAASNDFRNRNPNAVVSARLTRGLDGTDASRLLWEFTYSSSTESLTLIVDPTDLSVAVGDEEYQEIPASHRVYLAYPNPSSTTTNVMYDLAGSEQVTVKLIDLLGRTIRSIDRGVQLPGRHMVKLDVAGLARGSYLLSVRTGRTVASQIVHVR